MIKILLDPQIFNLQKFGGISRYYTELYTAFKVKISIITINYNNANGLEKNFNH